MQGAQAAERIPEVTVAGVTFTADLAGALAQVDGSSDLLVRKLPQFWDRPGFVAAAAAAFGVIHSPLETALIAPPNYVVSQMSADASVLCQSPYHWAAAYVLAAVLPQSAAQ